MDGNGGPIGVRSMVAAATIYPSHVVKQSPAGDFEVATAVTGDVPWGIAQEYQRGAPGTPFEAGGVAAVAGDEIAIYALGSICRAAVKRTADAIPAGAFVGPSSTGEIIQVTSGWAVGKLLESGNSGDNSFLRVQVDPQWVGSVGSSS